MLGMNTILPATLLGFMSWSTGHGLGTMLELHSLSVIDGEYSGMIM